MTTESTSPEKGGATAPPPSSAPIRKPRRILKILRHTIRGLVVMILLVAFAAALVYFTPQSHRWTDRLIREQTEKETGLELDFSRAEFTLSRGQLRIETPILRDPVSRTELVRLDSVECVVDMGALVRSLLRRESRTEVRLNHVAVMGPLELRLMERDGAVRLSPELSRMAEILEKQQASGGMTEIAGRASSSTGRSGANSAVKLSLAAMDLNSVRVELEHLSDDAEQALARISDADLRVEFEADSLRPRHLLCHGTIEGVEGSVGFKLDLQPNIERSEVALDLTLQPFDTNKHLLTAPKFHLKTATVAMRGMARRSEEGNWALFTDLNIPNITLADLGEERKDHEFEAAKVYAELHWNVNDRQIRLAEGKLASRDADLNAQGRLELFAPYRYAVNVDSMVLRDRSIALLEQLMVKEELVARPIVGGVDLRGTLNGRMEHGSPDEITLDFALGEIALQLADFPEPVTQVQLRGSFRNHEFLLTHGQARVQNIPIEFTGAVRGRLLEGRVEHAEVAWKTVGELRDISEIVRRNAKGPVSSFTYTGDIEGAGQIRFDNPETREWRAMMDKADFEGWLRFNKAELRHADLREPVRDLSGQFNYTRSAARLQNITGRMENVPFALEAEIQGTDRFWNDMRTTATLETTLNLADVEKYLEWLGVEKPDKLPELAGSAVVNASVRGPVGRWREWDYEGTAEIENALVPMDTRQTSGTLDASRIDLRFTPREITLARAEAVWQDVRLNATGRLGLDEGRITLMADGPLTGIKAALAKPLSRFVVGGRASGTHEVMLTRNDAAAHALASFADFFPERMDKDSASESDIFDELASRWTVNGLGEINLTDAEVTYDLMPTRLMGATGRLRLTHQRLWTEQSIPLLAGERSSGTMADVDINFGGPGEPTVIKGKISGGHFDVDQWIHGWKKIDRKGPPPPPEERERVRIEVAFDTNSVSYRGIQGEDLTGTLLVTDFTGKRHILAVKDVVATRGEGRASYSLNWEHFGTNDIFRHDIAVEKFEVAPLMKAFTSIKEQGGIASGLITGAMVLRQEGRNDPPVNGAGSFVVENSRFVSNAVLGGLGRVLRIEELFNDISFPRITGEFEVRNDVIHVESPKQVVFENPALFYPLDLRMQGTLGPSNALNLNVGVRFLPRVGAIPVIGKVWDVINSLTGKVFSYSVRGTIEKPEISLIR